MFSLYSRPSPVGLVTVTIAFPNPSEQSTVCTGDTGEGGCALITTLFEAIEIQPTEFVTVNVYVPSGRPVMVALVPLPDVVTAPGSRVKVHVPVEGNPVSNTLPEANVQVGCVMVPTTGAEGVGGWVLIMTLEDDAEVQPSAFVTVNVYVPAGRPVIVLLVPVPELVSPRDCV